MALKRPRAVVVDPIVPEPRPPQRAVTAATASVALGGGSAWATWRFGNREWQAESWRLYDIVGELRFLASWIGDSVSQARLYVTRIGDTGEESGEVTDDRIARLAAVPLGTGSQRDDNLRLLGIDLAVAGEAWIVGEGAATSTPENWFVLSGGQIRREGGSIAVQRPLQAGGEVLKLSDGKDMLIRAWRPHPNDIWQSDSPTRSAIPPLREIELLTKREFAELESRLVGAGMMPMPEGFDFPRGEGEPEGIEGFTAVLQKVAAENIRDQSRAAAMVPIMFTVPDNMMEHVDKIKPITVWSELSDNILPMKQAAIARVAASFEIPSELLAGFGDANHWSAWAISEEGIKRIKPYLATIADTLTRGFLIPTLEREGIPDAARYAYAFDTAPLAVRPNRLTEALELSDRYLLSDEETVKSGAFTTKQMPDGAERLKMLLFRSVAKDPSLLTDPGVQQALGMRDVVSLPAPAAPRELPAAEPPASQPDRGTPNTDDDGPPDGDSPRPGARSAVTGSTGNPSRLVAAKGVALRALEIAGGRLVTRVERKGHYVGTPRHEMHTRIGPIPTEKALRMLDGAFDLAGPLALNAGVTEATLTAVVRGYCLDRLTRGELHNDEDLRTALEGLA